MHLQIKFVRVKKNFENKSYKHPKVHFKLQNNGI